MQIPDFTPVERFVREVMPAIPGGLQRVTNVTGHLDLIGAAAADRGLATRTIGKTTYFYDGRWPVGGMRGWVPTLVGREALAISHSKALTNRMLQAAGVPIPAGITVGPDGFDDALAHLRAEERAMVLKPSRGARGVGITCGITSESDLRAAWVTAEAAGPTPSLVLEQQVRGVDIRAFVIGRRVVAAVTRVNAHVVGDGIRTLAELVEKKQRRRDEHNPRLAEYPIIVDAELLRRCGRALHDVPAAGNVIVLNSMANNHVGGDSVDVTDLAHPDLFQLAVDAARAIPGLGLAGVDLMTPDLGSAARAVVLEVNVQANIRVHLCPAYGKPRDVAGPIIDEMIATAAAAQRSDPRPRTYPTDRPESGPTGSPVERFVHDVLPTIPGGLRRVPSARTHVPLVKRAAKARGLTAVPLGDTTYFYDGQLAVGGLHKHRMTTLVGKNAIDVCDSKAITKQLLLTAGVPTPTGVALEPDQLDEAVSRLPTLGRAVLKPSYGMRARGVTCGISSADDLRAAWQTAERVLKRKSPLLVLEEHVDGIDIRVFVVGGRVVAAATRLPSLVVGDGRRSIAELVEIKQQQRSENAYLAGWPLRVDATLLARDGRTLDDVPAAAEVVVLSDVANLEAGGENVDVTELVHPDLLDLALAATRAVPGLHVAGVDLVAPDLRAAHGATVIELNAGANIGLHHHPAYGKRRDVAGAIIDEMLATAGAPPRSPARKKPRKASLARRVVRSARRRLSAR